MKAQLKDARARDDDYAMQRSRQQHEAEARAAALEETIQESENEKKEIEKRLNGQLSNLRSQLDRMARQLSEAEATRREESEHRLKDQREHAKVCTTFRLEWISIHHVSNILPHLSMSFLPPDFPQPQNAIFWLVVVNGPLCFPSNQEHCTTGTTNDTLKTSA